MNPAEIETIAAQAAKLNDLAQLIDDAEGARTGRDSGIALMLQDISDKLYAVASQSIAVDSNSDMTHRTI